MAGKSNKTMWITLVVAAVAVILVGYMFVPENTGAIEKKNTQARVTSAERQEPMAPDFALKDLEGNVVKLSDHRGKVVFVNFWATWCPPCRAEIPAFVDLVDKYGDDFVVLGISVDNEADLPKVPGFADSYNINYPVLFADGATVSAYGGIRSIPTTFVVDKEGFVVNRIVGARPYENFEQIIQSLM